jgi:hypothetical protein
MAKNSSLFKVEGTLDNVTFYKSADGHFVRTKGGVSKSRILNDPAFIRTRENGAEFGRSAGAGKMLRMASGTMVFKAKDAKLSSRLVQVMSKIKNLDTVSVRGERNVVEGLLTAEGQQLLRGFDFNNRAPLLSVLFAPFSVDSSTGALEIANFTPKEQLNYPVGATHISLRSSFVVLDFASGVSDVTYSSTVNLPIAMATATVSLTPSGIPQGSGTHIHLLLIEFFQEVNGEQYSLKNGAYNVLNIVDVV